MLPRHTVIPARRMGSLWVLPISLRRVRGGETVSHLGSLDGGNTLFAISDVTISTKVSGSELDAAVGHEESHVADAIRDMLTLGVANLTP